MKLILDTANIQQIKNYLEYLPVQGVTTNPSILKSEGKVDLSTHLKEIRQLIGPDKSLHIQTISETAPGIIQDAHNIVDLADDQVYIKVPVTQEGLKAIKTLKSQGFKITATAIYSTIQGLLATELGADYLAPYVNRMENLNTDPYQVIADLASNIERTNSSTKILAASFKNVAQVTKALNSGASHLTVGPDLIDKFLADSNITQATQDFASDWESVYQRKSIK